MTFDMTKCKIGDKLKARCGDGVKLVGIDKTDSNFPYDLSNGESVTAAGYYYEDGDTDEWDIIGFWEEESSEENDQPIDTEPTFPNVEPRTPYVSKVVYYRLHMNEIYHRDISAEEAEAIYEQLKVLLGK